ncbi:ferredoxin-type protein NapF [Enterovibrio calviensis]|uniref:ferredoxin-type protein NapF n=1 Tax=Enterovibrio calviensis TaxID=91359 RepID=UPI000485C484|nr:ferredoxin-type protein NapF [Enterovibrio calviensis]
MVDQRRRFFLRSAQKTKQQSLPWIKDIGAFTDHCTRCGECERACEEQIIVSGDGGFPTIDFNRGECTFCYACAQACPEKLFHSNDQRPWQQAISINENCLAQKNIECRSCHDACDERAIRFQHRLGSVAQPEININDCSGCGACVAPCPTNAISMEQQA